MSERLLPGCSSDWTLEVKLHGEAVIPALVCKQLGKVSHPYHRLLENTFFRTASVGPCGLGWGRWILRDPRGTGEGTELFPQGSRECLEAPNATRSKNYSLAEVLWQKKMEGKVPWKLQITDLSVNQASIFINPKLAH